MNHLSNTEHLDGKYLGVITSDFIQVADKLKEVAYIIQERGNYEYPIFIVANSPINLGALLIDQGEMNNTWYYYAAYLEALIEAQVIDREKVADFKATYKDPDEFCCLLVIDQAKGFHKFIYIPYPVD
ncbi:MAG: hypothetical protein BGO68_01005 [Candidatus Amoebophilus sp. 36-38]|nr:MAG: hypothetical protein BGO68_01005 [Candidatus Amoebophilus sp. 36-38]